MEDQRRLLKKELIDLDYQHRLSFERLKTEEKEQPYTEEKIKDNQRTQAAETEVKPESEYLEYSRRVQN